MPTIGITNVVSISHGPMVFVAYFGIQKLLRPGWSRLVYSLTCALVGPVTQLQALLAPSIRG